MINYGLKMNNEHAKSPKPAKRQHFIARFYLRNFAEPMFSDNLCVYDIRKGRWERRTPDGVGWFPHLCSMIDMEGNRTDDFDRFLKHAIEDPATPGMKKLATGESLSSKDRVALARFIALTLARSPAMMNGVLDQYVESRAPADRVELDSLVELWCQWTGKPYGPKSHNEFLKPSSFGAIWDRSQDFGRRLLESDWHIIRTSRDAPFVTSDWPVYAKQDPTQGIGLVTFPVSSEVALIVTIGGELNPERDCTNDVCTMNRGTIHRATEFIVACKESFPADEFLVNRRQ